MELKGEGMTGVRMNSKLVFNDICDYDCANDDGDIIVMVNIEVDINNGCGDNEENNDNSTVQ